MIKYDSLSLGWDSGTGFIGVWAPMLDVVYDPDTGVEITDHDAPQKVATVDVPEHLRRVLVRQWSRFA